MATISERKIDSKITMLVTGDSGSGKTGLLASLANAGKRVCVIDADNGLNIIANYLTEEGAKNFHYITLTNNKATKTSAFGQFIKILNGGWKDDSEDLGKIEDWGTDTVLVIDTLNFLGKHALDSILSQASKAIDVQPEIQEWGEAQRRVEKRIDHLCSGAVKCHVIVNTHLRGIEDSMGNTRFYPAGVGRQQCLDIGKYFNNLIRIDVKNSPTKGDVRVLRTISDARMSLKTDHPNKLEGLEEFDLGKLFAKLEGPQ